MLKICAEKTMVIDRLKAFRFLLLALPLVVLGYGGTAEAQKKNPYVCKEPDPESLCTAANACGSSSQPCSVDVKRTSNAASRLLIFPALKVTPPSA